MIDHPEGTKTNIGEDITGAKKAMEGFKVVNGPKGESVTSTPEDEAALERLKSRLEIHLKEIPRPKPESTPEQNHPGRIADMNWHMIEDSPSEVPHSHRPEADSQTQPVVDLQKEFDDALSMMTRTPYLGRYVTEAKYLTNSNYKTPEEIQAFAVLAHEDMAGARNSNNEGIVGVAFTAIRTGSTEFDQRNVNFYGMDQPRPRRGAAETIYKYALRQYKELTQDDLDRCVEVSLACGDVYTALDLMQHADKFITKDGGTNPVESAFNRLAVNGRLFKKAREIYYGRAKGQDPNKMVDMMDATLAAIGEEGSFAKLKDFPAAMRIKEEAQQRLRQRMIEERDEWYDSQQISNSEVRGRLLDDAALENMIEQALDKDGGWSDIDKQIAEAAERITDGEAANLISSELQRRLYPELSLDSQSKQAQGDAMGEYTPSGLRYNYGTYNRYENQLFGSDAHRDDLSPADKQAKVKKTIGGVWESETFDSLFSAQAGIKDILKVIDAPDAYMGTLRAQDAKFLSKDSSMAHLSNEQYYADKKRLARRIIAGVNFLQTVAQDPLGRRLLESEFGFSKKMSDPNNFEQVQEKVQEMFSKFLYTQKSNEQNIYNDVMEEIGDTDQINEDRRMMEQLNKVKSKETKDLTEGRSQTAREVLTNMYERTDQEHDALLVKNTSLRDPLAQQQKITSEIERIAQNRKRIEAVKPVGAISFGRLSGGMTEDEKRTSLVALDKRKAALESQLQEVTKTIGNLGGEIDPNQLTGLENRLAALRKLLPTAG